MLISYKAAYHLIDRFYTRKSLEGIINDCKEYFDEALSTAKELEDYDFLKALVTQRESSNQEFIIFFNYKNRYPTVLDKDKDLSLEAFAFLCVDSFDIPFVEFKDVVNSQAIAKGLEAKKITDEFEAFVQKVRSHYRLVEEKIGRNDQCPCGSGKKYKNCHGHPSQPAISPP